MKFIEVQFSKSVAIHAEKVFLDTRKEIVFVGRSNVGKSSLLNALFQKKDLVKTSSLPGKTKFANIFLVNKKYNFTDMPGYGFAKLGKEIQQHLDALISWYLEERMSFISQIVMVVDSKIGPQQTDIDMYHYIQELGFPLSIVLSKVDRLGNGEMQKALSHTQELLPGAEYFLLSSKKNTGVQELWKHLGNVLQ